MHYLLQTIPVPEVSADTLEAKKAYLEEMLRNTPPQDLLALLGQQALQFGLKVLGALAIYFVGGWIISLIRKAVKKSFTLKKTEATVATFTESLITIGLWVLLIIAVVGALGINTTSLAALLAAGGMAIGMALSGTVQNFSGGIMLLVFRPFKVGDFIEAQGFAGTVREIQIFNTVMTTPDNQTIIIPNGPLATGSLKNSTKATTRRVDIDVEVAYGTDPEEVRRVLSKMVEEDERIIKEGDLAPVYPMTTMSTSSIIFQMRLWAAAKDYWAVKFDTTERVYKELMAEGIEIPFPQMDVHIKN